MSMSARIDPPPYGDGLFANEPPSGNGINITNLFHIVEPKPDDPGIDSTIDSQYPNVAIITHDATNQFGGMWAITPLDLTMPFETQMYLHLGHQYGIEGSVADGMTFTLQNDPAGLNAIGGAGEGLGVYRGRKWTGVDHYTVTHGTYLRNSLVVEFDTFRNLISEGAYVNDPGNAGTSHCALIIPRADIIYVEDHQNVFYFTPTQEWVRFEAQWTPNGAGGGILDYSFAGRQMSYTINDIQSVFGGTEVYWGFTGATGEVTAVQAAAITRLPLQEILTEKIVQNEAGENIDQSTAYPGEPLFYTIRVTANQLNGAVGPVIVEDEISEYVELTTNYATVTTKSGSVYTVEFVFIDNNIISIGTNYTFTQDDDWLEIMFTVKVKDDAGGRVVTNRAAILAQGLPEPLETNMTEVTILPMPLKYVSDSSEAGRDGSAVAPGALITYDITFINYEETDATVIITDRLPPELDFVSATDDGIYAADTHTVTWILTGVPGRAEGTVSLVARVNETARTVIDNYAEVQVGVNAPQTTNRVEIPVNVCPPHCCPQQCCNCRRCYPQYRRNQCRAPRKYSL